MTAAATSEVDAMRVWDLLADVIFEVVAGAETAADEEPGAPRTLYINRPLLNADELIAWAHERGIKKTLPREDIHVTVAFSKSPVDWAAAGNSSTKVTVGRVRERSVERLGDEGAVVLRFESSALTRRWEQLRDVGASWDWPGYKPHVTITYNAGDVDLDKIEPYVGLLEFGPEIFAEVDADWADKVKDRMVGDASFEESAHPRGQPNNAGQFGKGGGSAKAKPAEYQSGKNPNGRTDREQYLAEHKPKGDPVKEAPDLTGGIPYDPESDRETKGGSEAMLPGEGGGEQLDQLKALEKIASEVLEKATPAQREQHEKHVEKTRKFFSSDEGRNGTVKAIKKFAAKHAVAMANYHLTDAVMLPVVHSVVEQAISAVGLGAVPGLTLGATAVASYAANHIMHHFNLTLGGAKELLVSTARNAIDVLGGVKEVTARIADLEKRGMMGADDARDPSVLDALILFLIAVEGLGDEEEQQDDTAKDEAATFEETKHPRAPDGRFGTAGGRGTEGGERSEETAKPDIHKSMIVERGDSTQPVKSLDELYERAQAEEPAFRKMVEGIAEVTGSKAKFTDKDGSLLKARESSERKLKDELGGDVTKLRDVIRGTVVGDSVEKTRDAAAVFIAKQGDNILRVKDRHTGPTTSGYRDILVNFRTPGGLVAELQFNSKAMVEAKANAGHKLYDAVRTGDLGGKSFDELQAMARAIYEKAYLDDGDGHWEMK